MHDELQDLHHSRQSLEWKFPTRLLRAGIHTERLTRKSSLGSLSESNPPKLAPISPNEQTHLTNQILKVTCIHDLPRNYLSNVGVLSDIGIIRRKYRLIEIGDSQDIVKLYKSWIKGGLHHQQKREELRRRQLICIENRLYALPRSSNIRKGRSRTVIYLCPSQKRLLCWHASSLEALYRTWAKRSRRC